MISCDGTQWSGELRATTCKDSICTGRYYAVWHLYHPISLEEETDAQVKR